MKLIHFHRNCIIFRRSIEFNYCSTHTALKYISNGRSFCSQKTSSTSVSVGDGENKHSSDLAPAYDPSEFEGAWLSRWNERVYKGKPEKNSPVFRMILPPPNVTGKLHLGHALTIAIQDTIARWKVMQGFQLKWIPGFDHAGIATHSVASRRYQHSGLAQDFKETIRDFAKDNLTTIQSQLKSLGAILDWEQSYYTLNDDHSIVVKEAFLQLLEAGVIQRQDGIVNWSCALESSVADIEVDHIDFEGKTVMKVPKHKDFVEFGVLHYISYVFENSHDRQEIIVATSRPETIFADVAIAVNPSDSRYSAVIGKFVLNPLTGKRLPIITDARVKPDFGTGALKITPAHDKLDFAIGSSHNLSKIDIFTNDGFLNHNAGSLKGKTRFDGRPAVLAILDKKGALKASKDYPGVINVCSRTGDVIEPKILPHWFLKTKRLTDKFLAAMKSKQFMISPDHFSVLLANQLNDPQDWCLSRQIKWGHKIPVFHHVKFPEEWVPAVDFESAKAKIAKKYNIEIKDDSEIIQDPDVLDTWFSSSLIPLSLSGWPDSKEVEHINLMETGSDILLFWVWRMMIVTDALVSQYPFHHILLHGIVCDKYGRKMSKSKGNVIDPMHVINGISFKELIEDANIKAKSGELEEEEFRLRKSSIESDCPDGFKAFGRDALRFALLSQNISGDQINLDFLYLENCRHFSNKMWQAMRFYVFHQGKLNQNLEGLKPAVAPINSLADLWLLSCLYEFARDVQNYLDTGRFHLYAESVRKFFYQQLCDVYIELIKNDLKNSIDKETHLSVMQFCFVTALKLSHPIIPFVTEQIWSHMSQKEMLIDQNFPIAKDLECFNNPKLHDLVLGTIKIAKEIRALKVRTGIKSKSSPTIFLDLSSTKSFDAASVTNLIERLVSCQLQLIAPPDEERGNYIGVIFSLGGHICKLSTPKGDVGDDFLISEKNKLLKLQAQLEKLKEQCENPKFKKFAPIATKEKLRKKVEMLENQISLITSRITPPENTSTS